MLLQVQKKVIVLPDLRLYQGNPSFSVHVPSGEIYHVGVVDGWIMARIDVQYRLRELVSVNPETNSYQLIRILKENIQDGQVLEQIDYGEYFGKDFWECHNLEISHAKRSEQRRTRPRRPPKSSDSVVYPIDLKKTFLSNLS